MRASDDDRPNADATYSGNTPGNVGTGPPRDEVPPFVSLTQRVEAAASLDSVAEGLARVVGPLASSQRTRGLLCGDWLGHAVHPLLTDLPLGAWTCTSLLDLFGGRRSRPAAEGLLAFGVVTAAPTVITGAAEWTTTTGASRRVGVLHAAINVTAMGLYGASLLARRRHHHALGVGLGIAGGVTASVGGYLGGHLTIARKVGSSHSAFHH